MLESKNVNIKIGILIFGQNVLQRQGYAQYDPGFWFCRTRKVRKKAKYGVGRAELRLAVDMLSCPGSSAVDGKYAHDSRWSSNLV